MKIGYTKTIGPSRISAAVRRSFLAFLALLSPVLATPAASAPRAEEIRTLLDQAALAETTDSDLARQLIDRAAVLASTPHERLQVDYGEVTLTLQLGDYRAGRELAQKLLPLAIAQGDQPLTASILLSLSRAHRLLGDFPEAMQALEEARDLSIEIGDESLHARVLSNIGSLLRASGNYEEALKTFEQAMAIARPLPLNHFHAGIVGNYGLALTSLKRYPEARAAQLEAQALMREAGSEVGVADALLNYAEVARLEGDYDDAIPAYRSALEVYEKLANLGRQNSAHLSLAEVLLKKGDPATAAEHLAIVDRLLEQTHSARHRYTYYRLASLVHEALGDYPAALDFARQYAEAREKLTGEVAQRELAAARADREVARKDASIANLERDRARDAAQLEQAAARLSRARNRYLTVSICTAAFLIALAVGFAARRRAERRILEETRQARTAAESADALKTRLLAVASHDLKAPLRTIEFAAEAAAKHADDPARVAHAHGIIRAEARRMFALIRDLIDLSALESQHLVLNRAAVDLAALLEVAVTRHTPAAQVKRLTLRLQIAPAGFAPLVSLDPDRFDQVVDNLIGNAIKFSPPYAVIEVGLQQHASGPRVSVRDHGPGFSPADYARVFQPFQTLSALATAGEPQSGLGLYIAREIVALHQGRLTIDSAPGEGATLIVDLPATALLSPAPSAPVTTEA